MELMCRKSGNAIFGLQSTMQASNLMTVRYEDLIADTVAVMQRVFGFIGADFNDNDAEAIRQAMLEQHGPQVKGRLNSTLDSDATRAANSEVATRTTSNMNPDHEAAPVVISAETRTSCEPLMALGNYEYTQS
eukprot:m.44334 g.44334  ORF g.44334 m.44334 type:complete len:133 (-) comp6509_c0_seq2:71-469(-)